MSDSYLEFGDVALVAGPHVAQACLLHQLALAVIVGDAGGHAHPTGPGALGPVRGLEDALLLQGATFEQRPPGWTQTVRV